MYSSADIPPPREATPEEVASHEAKLEALQQRTSKEALLLGGIEIRIPLVVHQRHLAFFRDAYKPRLAPMEGANALTSVGDWSDRILFERHCGWAVTDIMTGGRVTHEGTCKGCS